MNAELAWTLGLLLGLAGGYAACRLNSVTFKEYDRAINGWRNLHNQALQDLFKAWSIAERAEESARWLQTPAEVASNVAARQLRCRVCGADRFVANFKFGSHAPAAQAEVTPPAALSTTEN
jgi:hypothetical protein